MSPENIFPGSFPVAVDIEKKDQAAAQLAQQVAASKQRAYGNKQRAYAASFKNFERAQAEAEKKLVGKREAHEKYIAYLRVQKAEEKKMVARRVSLAVRAFQAPFQSLLKDSTNSSRPLSSSMRLSVLRRRRASGRLSWRRNLMLSGRWSRRNRSRRRMREKTTIGRR